MKQDSVIENRETQRAIATAPQGRQELERSEADFELNILNIFKEIKCMFKNSNRKNGI